MTAQTPAANIMQTGNWTKLKAKAYRVACDCHHPDHDLNVWIETESDKEFEQVVMTFYVNVSIPFWQKGFNRFREAWNILVRGYSQYEHGFILNEQTAENLIAALRNSTDELKNSVDQT